MTDYTTLFDAVLMEKARREGELNRNGRSDRRVARGVTRQTIAALLIRTANAISSEAGQEVRSLELQKG